MSSREKVLKILEQNKTSYISGESLAATLGLSRNAIWKAINELRKQGYDIQAISHKGYLLGEKNDIISKEGILSYLGDEITDINGKIHIFDDLDSTNKAAKELAISKADHGTLIVARKQTIGKGRKNHSFYSPEGGIYMSIILSPDKLATLDADSVTRHTGVCVCKSIERLCGISTRIKPINDLFVGDRKICGILIESGTEFETGLLQWIVVGIGINFDSDLSSFPDELKPIAGSLFSPGEAPITKNQLIADIYKALI